MMKAILGCRDFVRSTAATAAAVLAARAGWSKPPVPAVTEKSKS